ncbi:MAG TPA: hypothetical protein VK672_08725, partial [Solirubrobacteraceae bacterium]|nr:hypothetical protein [Solirubrobacteraceae bacterium]
EVLAARDYLTTFAHKDGSWPAALVKPASAAPASAPHTALAALALIEGNESHRDAAKRGSKWLLEHSSAWGTMTDREEVSAFEQWWHMTFSLGLRACLSAHVDPLAPELAPTIDLLDRLWVGDGPGAHQWRGGDGAQASVHGSHGVVLAYEHLRRAQRQIDPITLFDLIRTSETTAEEVRHYFEFEFDDNARLLLIVDTRTGQGVDPIRLGVVGWRVVKRVAELQYSCEPPRTSIALDELDGISDDIKALIRRINNTVMRSTGMRLKKLLMTPNGTNTCMLAIRPKSAVPLPSSASASGSN